MTPALSNVTRIVLRAGVAFAFLYPPYAALRDPVSWLAYFPHGLLTLGIPGLVLLHGFGALEVIIAIWILSGWKIYYPAALAAVILVVIVILNAAQFDVVFRDLSIAAAAAALMLDAWQRERRPAQAS